MLPYALSFVLHFVAFQIIYLLVKISGDERDEGNGSELESTVDDEDGDEDLECEMVNVEAIRAQQQQMDDDVTPEGKEVLSRVQQG